MCLTQPPRCERRGLTFVFVPINIHTLHAYISKLSPRTSDRPDGCKQRKGGKETNNHFFVLSCFFSLSPFHLPPVLARKKDHPGLSFFVNRPAVPSPPVPPRPVLLLPLLFTFSTKNKYYQVTHRFPLPPPPFPFTNNPNNANATAVRPKQGQG